MSIQIISKKQIFILNTPVPVDRYPYNWYTILLGATLALAHIGVYFTHHVFDLSVTNENNELIPTRVTSGWRVCIDYRKLNAGTRKHHFPLPFVDQMLERVAGHEFYYFLDGYSGYNQIGIVLEDQEKTTFTCPFGTFSFRKMPFGLCNALGTFQRCMIGFFSDMIEIILEIFMDDFSVFGDSYEGCLENLRKVLERCQEKNLVLNWEKCHFMMTQGIVLGHIV